MPENAKKVFTGEIFDVYQWDQELFDGSTRRFEIAKRPDTVSVIATKGSSVVLARELQPHWSDAQIGLFGGRIDEGEEPLAAAKRELAEEAGLVSESWELLFSVSPFEKIEWTIHVFAARDCRKERQPAPDPGERFEAFEVPFEEFLLIACSEGFRGKIELGDRFVRMRLDGGIEEFRRRIFP